MENILLNDFFFIKSSANEADANNVVFIIKLDAHHKIFDGHFPQQAVVPGVCMVEIIKECVSEYLGYDVDLVSASNIKYTNLMIPEEGKKYTLSIHFKDGISSDSYQFNISSGISDETTTYIKFQGSFKKSTRC